MLISELSKLTRLSIHTIRFYEKSGLIDENLITRSDNNYKNYDNSVVLKLQIIKYAKNAGFSLSEISSFLKDGASEGVSKDSKLNLLEGKLGDLNLKISEIEIMKKMLIQKIEKIKRESSLNPK